MTCKAMRASSQLQASSPNRLATRFNNHSASWVSKNPTPNAAKMAGNSAHTAQWSAKDCLLQHQIDPSTHRCLAHRLCALAPTHRRPPPSQIDCDGPCSRYVSLLGETLR